MTAQTMPSGLRRSLDGSRRKMFIGGQWVDAVSGKTFETRNPATGALLATVPASSKADIDRAVAAARSAFDGAWSRFKPYERQVLLLKIADLFEKHWDELSLSDSRQVQQTAPDWLPAALVLAMGLTQQATSSRQPSLPMSPTR